MHNKSTLEQLDADNRELRARLETAEATLRELLSGEADALFVRGEAGEQLFSVKSGDQAYRILIENMSEGALTLTPEGLVLYANGRFAEILRMPLEKVIGSEIHTWFVSKSQQVIQTLLQTKAGDKHSEELTLAAADGTQVPVYLSVIRVHQEGIPDALYMVATDLSEQKRNEAILAAEKLTHAILEQAADAIVICDETGRIIRASKQAQLFYGNDLDGQLFEHAFPLSLLDGAEFLPVGAVDIKQLKSVEARLTHNGRGYEFLVSVGHLSGAQNQLLGSVVTLTDITGRNQTEQEIKLKNTMLQTQQDTSPDAILVVDEQQRVVTHNQQFNALWQIPTQLPIEWMDAPLLKVVSGKVENSEEFLARVRHLYEQRGDKSRDEILLKDGRVIDRHSAPVTAAGGKYYGRIWYFRDITERKRAEESLNESEQKQRAIFENASDGILVAEVETGKIVSGNPAICGMLGYTLEELLCLAISDIHPKRHLLQVMENFRKVTLGDLSISTDISAMRKDGSTFYVDISAGTLRMANKDCVVGIFRDISERKQAQDSIFKLNEELEEKVLMRTAELDHARRIADHANNAKSDFLAVMSHEIRTPMNGVIGMIDVLQQSSLNEVQMDMANIIHDSAYALLGVINDILDFAKIEAGKVTLESVPMSLTEIVEGVGDMLAHTAFNTNVSLRLFIEPALSEQIIGDARRLRQILVNLVSNAIKFSGGQARLGKVLLRARQVVNTKQKLLVEFSVTDNGIGMDKATQTKLFKPFTQANSSTAAKFGGTGLGLVITQQLVHMKGGEIIMSSGLDKGTEMRVRLPFKRLQQSSNANKLPLSLAGLDCLLVDFKDGLADDLAAYLAHAGAQLERVGDVDAARRWLSDCPAGQYVIVLDSANAESVRIDLRGIVGSRSNLKMAYVLIGREERRHSRVEADDVVQLNGDNLHFSELVRAVGIAAGRIPSEIETQATRYIRKQVIDHPSREMAIQQGSLILVAEDNEINQKVILHQLRLLGHAADVADNGREALEKWQSGDYSILLTDLNMPEMNGWELTAAIRTAEGDNSHFPIIALTANALKGEADRCREMGMDDYLSKPVMLANLKATLDKWLPLGGDAPIDSKPHQANTSVPVDVSVLKALVGDDEEIIRAFLHDFWLSAVGTGSDLRVACDAGQAVVAGGLMHKFKSSARTVGALALGELCAEMEVAGTAGSNETLTLLLPMFEQELNAVNLFIESLLELRANRYDDKQQAVSMNKATIRILVLDDEAFMLKLLTHMLAGLGYTSVTTCDNGYEALQFISASDSAPNLILLDLQMPEMDGIEFVRKLVEHNYSGNLILVSGEDERVLQMAEKLIQAHEITVLGHLKKPVSVGRLSSLLEKSIHTHTAPQRTKHAYSKEELRAAIDAGELINYYQPKVAITTGAVVGVETLVRWRHPVNGMVFPDQFIGVAEEYGLIDDLTREVMKGAISQSKVWRQAGLRLRIAVNVSMDNLSSVAFADYVANAAHAAGVPPQDIVLEVTESRLVLDQRAPLEVLTRLRLKRFSLSIDDFGTGHSSLTLFYTTFLSMN